MLAIAGGVVTQAAFPGRDWWWCAYLGVALLLLALRRDSAGWGALTGLAYGLAFFGPHLLWSNTSAGLVPWLALTVVEALYVGLLGAAWAWARRAPTVWRSGGAQVLTFALLWVAVEELRAAWPFGGMPWGRLAFSQTDAPLLRLAWLGGAPLVSGVTAAVGALLAWVLLAAARGHVLRAAAMGAVAVGLFVAGLVVPLDTQAQSGTLRVGAVQGNVPRAAGGGETTSQARQVLANHAQGTRDLLRAVGGDGPAALDLVLWPESSTDIDPQADDAARAVVQGSAEAVGVPILVGTQEFPESGGRYNVGILWDPDRGVVARYAKQHPVPYGEYIPMRSFVRRFSTAVDRVRTDMLPGVGVGVLPFDSPRLGRQVMLGDVICFEVAYDELITASVDAGAEVLVVQTNNASFGHSDESVQQLAMSRFRAVEHGRATIQISTVGVSGIIAPNGVVEQRTELWTPAQLVATVPLRTSSTPATVVGPWPARVIAVIALFCVGSGFVAAARTRREERRREW